MLPVTNIKHVRWKYINQRTSFWFGHFNLKRQQHWLSFPVANTAWVLHMWFTWCDSVNKWHECFFEIFLFLALGGKDWFLVIFSLMKLSLFTIYPFFSFGSSYLPVNTYNGWLERHVTRVMEQQATLYRLFIFSTVLSKVFATVFSKQGDRSQLSLSLKKQNICLQPGHLTPTVFMYEEPKIPISSL